MKKIVILLLIGILIFSSYIFFHLFYIKQVHENYLVSPPVVSMEPTLPPKIEKVFTILLAPGHDPKTGGATYNGIYERNLAVIISMRIKKILKYDKKYKVIITRDEYSWSPVFSTYFNSQEKEILHFKNKYQALDKALFVSGKKKYVPDKASHTQVNKKVAIELYGINKWANEHPVDLVVNIHFNDSGRKDMNKPGTYKGFAIYVPESQMVNAKISQTIARYVYVALKDIFTPEDIPGQNNSIIEDQSLIALGASGTLQKPSILIEYGYIYEKILRGKKNREDTLDKMAKQTVAGIQAYVTNLKNK